MPSSPLESQVKLFLVVGGRIISAASWVGIIPLFQTAGERSASKEVYHTQSKIIVSFNSYLPISLFMRRIREEGICSGFVGVMLSSNS